ncbi:expansin-like A1 isoform X2 [Cucurbita moschata]|uniref:Expansin-like A1 isoform X2 n=1 Tax=Cucurbita moschata TaxID=3662 RepID=A0A6J1EKB8_CUCMO|nr:expansin-like A1 isoform X2 [Cucurbita moschata]
MGLFLCLLLFFLASSASACDRCLHHSKTAYISNDSTLSSGACGYGSLALGFLDGHLAAGVPSLYKEGVRCGACYQMRCKDKKLCSTSGTKLILTDLNLHTNRTDLVLSKKAFSALAQKGQHYNIFKRTTLDVEYKRIPCEYKKQNLSVRIEESSQKPHHMAVKFLYQGGLGKYVLHEQKAWDGGVGNRHGTGGGGGVSTKSDFRVRRDVGDSGAGGSGGLEAGDDLRPWSSDGCHCQRTREL